jgi:hypothetical protein
MIDNMLKRNWPCDSVCPLFICLPKTMDHLLTRCNFTKALWNPIVDGYSLPNYNTMAASGGPIQWVRLILSSVNKKEKKIKLGNLLFLVEGLEGEKQEGL